MMRVAGFISLFSVFTALFLTAQPASAIEPNPWSSNISSQSVGPLTPQSANNRYDCETKNAQSVSVSGANALLFKVTTLLTGLIYTNLGDKCIVTNDHGVFATRYFNTTYGPIQTSEYFGNTSSKMYDLVPTTATGQWIDPAPAGNTVLYLTKVSGSQEYYVSVFKNFSDGYPKIRSSKLTFDFLNTATSWFVDKTGGAFRINRHAFSPNGRYMAVSYNNTIAKIDLQTMKMTPVIYASGAHFMTAAISNDGRFLALPGGEVRVYDSLNCAISYDSGKWERQYASADYTGCTSTNYPSTYLKNTGTVLSGSTYKRPHFGVDNKTLYVALSAGTSENDWTEIKFTANNQTFTVEGYLAMGDSFSSGEGDLFGGTWYEPGTDEQGNKDTFEGRNLCHLSRRSYPYLIAKELGLLSGDASEPTTPTDSGLFHSVACSGAVIHNVIGGSENGLIKYLANAEDHNKSDNQYSNSFIADLGRWQPGRLKQLDTVSLSDFGGLSQPKPVPEVITLGIAGNDAGFGDTIKACTMPGTCKQAVAGSIDASNLALRIVKLKPKLVETYKAIKSASPDSRVYVHGYPIFVQGYNGNCDTNVLLNEQETALVEEGVKLMNNIVKAAAKEAGVFYVDVTNILEGKNLCSGVKQTDITVNGITSGNDINHPLLGLATNGYCFVRTGCLGSESYHPNPKAHQLYKESLLNQSNNLTATMPVSVPAKYPLPDAYFGQLVFDTVVGLNGGQSYSVIIPEPKPFLSNNAGSIKINQSGLMPGSILRVELQSTPITLAEFTVPVSGVIQENIVLPANTESGSHELHLLGVSNFGDSIDYYEPIVIAVSETDFDGDGVLNEDDICPTIVNSFIDFDNDGIDDACDPNIEVLLAPEDDSVNLDKGQPNPETVAGNEELTQVLGATTSNNSAEKDSQQVLGATNLLENTGTVVAVGLFAGITTFSITILMFSLVRRD